MADDIRACLARRWPDSEYLHVYEAPQRSDRSGRKLDVLVVSLWQSRGLELDGVEIKVSRSDWRRELKNAAKADWWWKHVHRFWVAMPAEIAETVLEELPAGWGLLACESGAAPKVVRKPKRNDPDPLPWVATVGVMRAAADSGFNALQRARSEGYENGYRAGKEEAVRQGSDGVARRELEALRQRVELFEQASGIDIAHTWDLPEDIGTLVAMVRAEQGSPRWAARMIGDAARSTIEAAERLVTEARKAEQLAERVSEMITGASAAVQTSQTTEAR